MGESSNKKFRLGLFYQTPTGRAGAKNTVITAKNETGASRKAEKAFKAKHKGIGYKVQGGNAHLIK